MIVCSQKLSYLYTHIHLLFCQSNECNTIWLVFFKQCCFLRDEVDDPMPNLPHLPGIGTGSNPRKATLSGRSKFAEKNVILIHFFKIEYNERIERCISLNSIKNNGRSAYIYMFTYIFSLIPVFMILNQKPYHQRWGC